MLYLDYCATTPLFPEVAATIASVMKEHYGNPSSLHRMGLDAERLVSKSREVIAKAIQCKPDEILFTSCGTESNNLAIRGSAQHYAGRGKHLITSIVEHASVYECCKQLERDGYTITYLPVNSDGQVSVDDVYKEIRKDTILVSVMHINNEVGSIQPIAEIGKLLADYPRILYHVDAIQSLGKLPIIPSDWRIDMLSASAHKIRGPKGAAFLYKRAGIELVPLLSGGGQEFGFRSGTENVPLIVGMAKAVRMSVEPEAIRLNHLYAIRKRLVEGIIQINGLLVNGSIETLEMAPHIVNFSFPGMRSEVVVHALEQKGYYISSRSACSSATTSPSRVLSAMGYDNNRAASGLRVSYNAECTFDEIEGFIKALELVTSLLAKSIQY